MKMSEAFPTKYVSAADLQGREVEVTIANVVMEAMDTNTGEHKPCAYFHGTPKGLVLNKTNANTIADAYGDDTDQWIGHPITLFPSMTDFAGKQVACIRVKINGTAFPMAMGQTPAATAVQPHPVPIGPGQAAAQGVAVPPETDLPLTPNDLDDEIPF